MIVKKYVVSDIKEAFEKIRVELGKDAVILSTRKIKKGGFLGIGAKTYIEVTAAVEEKKQQQGEDKGQIYKLQEILSKTKQPQQSPEDITELKKMMLELKSMMVSQRSNEPQWVQDFRKALSKQDIDEEISEKIIEYARVKYQELDFSNENTRLILSEMFLPFLNTSVPELKGKVMFVGPTGVGKTTTLAKLAAKLKLNDHRRVGIITLDTYRIAAVDQLKTYAMLLDVPIRVAYTPKEAKLEIEALADYDIILIDSAGRSQKNELHMTEIKAMSEIVEPDYVFLVVGMQYRSEDVKEIASKFSIVSPTHVILSKMDETSSLGHFVNVPTFLNVPIAFVTNGQRVPDDIIEANSRELAVLLSREVLKNARSSK
ncbi:MAG: flagellar biosynthesis protein FlhF [Fervidobacterium sp.]|uniref:flagellar biosynthesis protein FlhF n=1 Tax=Fervidobacterium sp. TaxID=1871331 RepID=UPI00404B3386